MRFIDRVKQEMKKNNNTQISMIDAKIEEKERVIQLFNEEISSLNSQLEELEKKNSEIEKELDLKKEKKLDLMYNLILNYLKIKKITEVLKSEFDEYSKIYEEKILNVYEDFFVSPDPDKETENQFLQDELAMRELLVDRLRELNNKIVKILKLKSGELLQDTSFSNHEFGLLFFIRFARMFNNFFLNAESILSMNYSVRNALIQNNNDEKSIKSFLRKRPKSSIELEGKKDIIKNLQPAELWNEINRYKNILKDLYDVIREFENNKLEYMDGYLNVVEFLGDIGKAIDIYKLDKYIQWTYELKKELIELKEKNSKLKTKLSIKRRELSKVQTEKNELISKRNDLEAKNLKIDEVQSLDELGFNSMSHAKKKLNIETNDYVIIPIPKDIYSIFDLFNKENRILIQVGNKKFYTSYRVGGVSGKINSVDGCIDTNSVLMIPISKLKTNNVNSVNNGYINLNESILEIEGLILILSDGRKIDIGELNIDVQRYKGENINRKIHVLLGIDYKDEDEDHKLYTILKKAPKYSELEQRYRREAIKKALFENINKEELIANKIYIDGNNYFLNSEDEKDLDEKEEEFRLKGKRIDTDYLLIQIEKINNYLENYQNNGSCEIDKIYQDLILEYMKVNPKAKSEYYDEQNTIVKVNGKKMSIKPLLPVKNEDIAKRYTRKDEDIAYKIMKLAQIINRFAHIARYNNEKIEQELFDIKLKLVERVIDLSQKNENIVITKKFDEEAKAKSVNLDIPGYCQISLHIINQSFELVTKSNNLDNSEDDILRTSIILNPGVNMELLEEMQKMCVEDRIKICLGMDDITFYKFVLRMGYNLYDIGNDKREFIKNIMLSDVNIERVLEEERREERQLEL